MKKVIATTLASLALLSFGAAFAQPTASDAHELDITIPQLLLLQIVDGAGDVVAAPSVAFVVTTAQFLTAADTAGGSELAPSSSNFADVQVLTNNAAWSVSMSASALSFTPAVAGSPAAGLDLGDVRVLDGLGGTLFTLDTATPIATGSAATTGWDSLGFGGDSFRLTIDGDEEPGDYSWTITYTVTAP